MTKPVNLPSSRMGLFNKILSTLKGMKVASDTPLLFIFWGSRGSGKTTFLNTVKKELSAISDVEVLGFWDAKNITAADLSYSIKETIGNKNSKIKLIFIDNLDALLKDTSGTELFDFESNTLLPLIQRGDVVIVTGSQIEINLWQEYDIRVKQENHQLIPLKMDEIEEILHGTNIDKERAEEITFGHPKILELFLSNPDWAEKEASYYANEYFLNDLSTETKELTQTASIFPVFDIFILRKIKGDDQEHPSDMLTWYNDQINELTQRWIVQFDAQVGAYRFTDDAVRRLISRNYQVTSSTKFIRIHQIAAEYYQEEAKNTSYLAQLFVSAIYHIAQSQSKNKDKPGTICLRWVKDMQNKWFGANWEQVLNAWESGSGNDTVKEEIILLIGSKYHSKITELLSENKIKSEV